jgi:hypothetical protein
MKTKIFLSRWVVLKIAYHIYNPNKALVYIKMIAFKMKMIHTHSGNAKYSYPI